MTPDTIADGRLARRADRQFFPEIDDILLAEEDEIVAAMRLIWQRMKLVVEPSCAVPLATILRHAEVFAGRRVGVILTGGNVDLDRLPW